MTDLVGSYLGRVSVRPGLQSLPIFLGIARFTRREVVMADTGKKRKMAGRREATAAKRDTAAATPPDLIKWPPIKPKQNLQISRIKETDLFTVSKPSILSFSMVDDFKLGQVLHFLCFFPLKLTRRSIPLDYARELD